MAVLHALCLRDLVREAATDDAFTFASRWDQVTASEVEPLFRDTLRFDRHRLAQIEAEIAGVPYETDDSEWQLGEALRAGASTDPDLLRAYASLRSMLARDDDVIATPGVVDKARAMGPPEPAPGPTRAELIAIVGA
jgi:hypothetical protein